ncbi:hypothetical protein [Tabrizicola sp.]|uniref:hypothetical protein n=1 Tax=Tabrizicola sp. TaxID=2005166 RepID=UPI002FDE3E8D
MFFTKVGLGVARLAFWLGAANVVIGAISAFTDGGPSTVAGMSPGRLMNSGLYGMLIGVGLGILAEISQSIAAKVQQD